MSGRAFHGLLAAFARVFAGTFAGALSAVLPSTIAAEAPDHVTVDRIVAVVDSDVVTWIQLEKRAAPLLRHDEASAIGDRLEADLRTRRDALSKMIDERIMASVAATAHVTASDTEVDNAIVEVMKQNGLTKAGLSAAVHDAGMTDDEYREELRRQLVEARVVQIKVASKIKNATGLTPDAYRQKVEQATRTFIDDEKQHHYIEVRL
jgi:peptidyl-prolyl cis-trans isomerase SurA